MCQLLSDRSTYYDTETNWELLHVAHYKNHKFTEYMASENYPCTLSRTTYMCTEACKYIG